MKKKQKKNLKTNVTNFYLFLAVFFVAGFGFFGTSKLFMAEDVPVNHTELNVEYDLRENGKFTLKDWTYDEEQNLMEVTVLTNGIQSYATSLDFISVPKKNVNNELPIEVVYNEDDIYVLHIKEVPKNFEQVALRFNTEEKIDSTIFENEETTEKEEEENIISTVYADERVIKKEEIENKNFTSYALEITDGLIEETEEERKNIDKKIETINAVNEEILKEIERLKSELLYQTVDEQVETNNEIYRLEKEIDDNNREKEILNTDVKNAKTKAERLQQKKYDLNIW